MNFKFALRLFTSSIGRKTIMAASGLALAFFMLVHLAENLLLLKGEAAYNGWVDFLLSNPLIPVAEIGLLILFLAHIITGLWVRYENYKAGGFSKYEESKSQGGRTIGSATMIYTAFALLAYLVYHMIHFRFADHSVGFYQMVTEAFRNKLFVSVYVAGALALALHLSHGFQSAFQTLGLNHDKYSFLIKAAGYAVAVSMILFAMLSVYFLLGMDLRFAPLSAPKVLETVIN
ncbi:MAG: succinate dehydrogenase cytochrome b subunit [Elusimicrobia bacterium]|nr:succinate dehydrogenase cytochrome b subunit [Elusimicrobiota bacterium]